MSSLSARVLKWFEGFVGREDTLAPSWTLIVSLIAVGMAVLHLVQIYRFVIPTGQFRNLHVGLALIIIFLTKIERTPRNAHWRRLWLILFSGLTLIPLLYIHFEYPALVHERQFGGNEADMWVAILLIILGMAAVVLEWGWPVPLLALVSLIYAYYGYLLPGELFFHSGMNFPRLISITSIPAFRGMFGSLTEVSAGTIFLFMVFAGVLKATGGLELIIRVAYSIGGRSLAGPAQVAVVSSGLMGMISGSTVANVASTGAFTIPTMKRFGFSPEFAGATEAVASTGGQIMPPVMGLAAFLMVGVTGIKYVDIMVAAAFPALVYYLYLMVAVHLRAARRGLDARNQPFVLGENGSSEEMTLFQAFRRWGHLLVGILVLIYFLVIRMPPGTAALYAIISLLVLEALKQFCIHWRTPLTGFQETVRISFRGLDEGARSGAQVAAIIVVINILVEVLVVTAFAQRLSHLMLDIAGNNLVVLMILAAITCLLFGLGLPTSAAYILVALLGAPALVELGVPLLAAHMYVFFFANVSSITPPVAVAALVGANIAKARFFPTALLAVRLGLPGFLLPFLFIAHPEILGINAGFWEHLLVSFLALIAVVALNIAMEGYLLAPLRWVERLLLLPAAFGLLYPGWETTAAGLVLLGAVFTKEIVAARKLRRSRRQRR